MKMLLTLIGLSVCSLTSLSSAVAQEARRREAPPLELSKSAGPDAEMQRQPTDAVLGEPINRRDQAQEAPSVNIRIELQIVDLPEKIATPLIDELKDKAKIEGAYERIQKLLAEGTAKLVDWPVLTTKSGSRAVIESIDEIRYVTEYAQGVVEVNVTAGPMGILTPKANGIQGLEQLAIPTAFETRNAGVTLEVEPILSPDGKSIDLNLAPQHVRLRGMIKQTVQKEKAEKSGERVVVEQPNFETMKVTTSLTLKNGGRTLMGVFRTTELPDHLEIFTLKAETQEP